MRLTETLHKPDAWPRAPTLNKEDPKDDRPISPHV